MLFAFCSFLWWLLKLVFISVPLSCLMLNVLHPPDGVSAAGWLNALATQLAVHDLGGLQKLQLPAASHWMKRSKSRMLLFCSLVVGMKRRQLKKLADPWQSLQTWTLPYQLVRVNLSALQPTRSSCTLRLFLSLSLCQVICHATISSLMWSFELLPVRMGRLFAAFWNGGFLWKGSPFQSQSFWVEGSKWRRVNLCLVPGNAAHLDLQMRAKVHGSMWRSTTPCAVQSFAFQARRSGMLFWTKLVPLHSSLLSILASPLTWDPTKRSWMTEPGRFSMHCSLHGKHHMAVAMVAVAMMHPSALPTYNCCLTQPLHLWWLPAGVVKQMLLTACFAARPLLVHKVGQAPAVMRWWLWGWLAWHALLTSQTSCCSPPFLSPAGFACDRRDVTSCHLGRPEQRFLFHQSNPRRWPRLVSSSRTIIWSCTAVMFIFFRRFLPRCHAASDQRSHMSRTWAGEEIAKLMIMRIMRSQCLSWCATCARIQALGQIQAAGFDGALKSLGAAAFVCRVV